MAITANSIFDRHGLRIQEVLNKRLEIIQAELDPLFRNLIASSMGVVAMDALGRDLKYIRMFYGSFAGVMDSSHVRNQWGVHGDLTTNVAQVLHLNQLNKVFPDPTQGASPTAYRLGIELRGWDTNLMFTLGELMVEATPATIGMILTPKLNGFARLMAHMLTLHWYMNQNDSYKISGYSATPTVAAIGGAFSGFRITFSPDNLATHRYKRGMQIDIIDPAIPERMNDTQANNTLQTPATRISLVVESVDAGSNVVTAVTTVDPATWQRSLVSITNTGVVHLANQAFLTNLGGSSVTGVPGIAGLNSWIKPSGAGASDDENFLLGSDRDTANAIDTRIFREFKSAIFNTVGNLTEHFLRRCLSRYHMMAMPFGHSIDCLITTPGVRLAYESNKIGMERIDRTNALLNIGNQGSADGWNVEYDGHRYKFYTSHYVESGALYGVKKEGNWKKIVPPKFSKSRSMAQMEGLAGQSFEFMAPELTGTDSTRLPILKTGQYTDTTFAGYTEGIQMPGRLRFQMVPDQTQFLKMSGITEDNLFASL